jgi:hypothetical protein
MFQKQALQVKKHIKQKHQREAQEETTEKIAQKGKNYKALRAHK